MATRDTEISTDTEPNIHPKLIELCDDLGLEYPEPGEKWEFETDRDEYDRVSRVLTESGCQLHQNYRIDDDRRKWEYTVREPGWESPLGHVPEAVEVVDAQSGWTRRGMYTANIRGPIPQSDDEGMALHRVAISPPGLRNSIHAKPRIDFAEDLWTVTITYARSSGRSTTRVTVFSSQLGDHPDVTEWKGSSNHWDKNLHVEQFSTSIGAFLFIKDEIGLEVPEAPERVYEQVYDEIVEDYD